MGGQTSNHYNPEIREKLNVWLLFLSALLTVVVFLVDLSIPLGIAGGVPYIAVVLVSLWLPGKRYTVAVAAFCTGLTILGFFWSPTGGELGKVLANRVLALFAIWVTASLSLQRKRTEQDLHDSEEQSRAIVETVIEGVVSIDEQGSVRSFNAAAERIFGYPAQEVVGQIVSILMPETDRSEHDDYMERYLQTEKAKILATSREVMGLRKNGGEFPMQLGVGKMHLQDRLMFVGTVRDLTESKRIQEEISQSRNLAALGEMAIAVAHEIKNPLAAIMGVIDVLKENTSLERNYREVMQELSERVGKLDDMIKRLLIYAKPWKPEKQLVNLTDFLVLVTASVEKEETFTKVRFVFDGKSDVTAFVDPTLMKHVFLNLIHNAADAMQSRGEIKLTLAEMTGVAAITVADTGPGIPSDKLEKLFQPFFTTKSNGTGLGLPICRKILEAHGGSIGISSEIGSGTTVTVHLPK